MELNFTSWGTAQSVKVIPKGTEVEISATTKHPLGGTYYLSEYSYSKESETVINIADCRQSGSCAPVVPPVIPEPPVVPEKPISDTDQRAE